MTTPFQEIVKKRVEKEEKKVLPKISRKKPKQSNPKLRSNDPTDFDSSSNRHNEYIGLLESTLDAPFLGLLKTYVKECSPKNKTVENNMIQFITIHKNIFTLFFIFDLMLKFIFVGIIILFSLRGLGFISNSLLIK